MRGGADDYVIAATRMIICAPATLESLAARRKHNEASRCRKVSRAAGDIGGGESKEASTLFARLALAG